MAIIGTLGIFKKNARFDLVENSNDDVQGQHQGPRL